MLVENGDAMTKYAGEKQQLRLKGQVYVQSLNLDKFSEKYVVKNWDQEKVPNQPGVEPFRPG